MTKLQLLASVGLLAVVGCQTMPYQPYARDVKRRPQSGGVIALHTEHRDEDRLKADEMMKSNCGANAIKVTEEGEVVVGQTTNTNANQNTDYGNKHQVGTLFGMPVTSGADASTNTNSTATTTQVKEWQIVYDCVAATETAPAAAPVQTASVKKAKKAAPKAQ